MHDTLYYRHSGRIGSLGLPLMLGFGLGGGLLLGIPYAYAVNLCPLVYINLLITIAFGVAIGMGVNIGARRGLVRNLPLLLVGGILSGLMAEYVAWVGYVHAVAKEDVWPWSPGDLYQYMQIINEHGIWSIHNSTPTGIGLAIIWLMEVAIIVGMATYLPFTTIGRTPFNEHNDSWAETVSTLGPFRMNNSDRTFVGRLEAGDVAAIADLTPAPGSANSFYQCLITTCPGDDKFILLSVESVTRSTDKDGKVQVTNRSILRHLFITDNMRKAIEAKAAEPVNPGGPKPAVEKT